MKYVNRLLHDQHGSSVAQTAALAIIAAALIGAMLLIAPGLIGATDRSFSCLLAAISGGGGGCAVAADGEGGGPLTPGAPGGAGDQGWPPPQYDAPDNTRPLTPEERALAEEIFGPGALDLDAIRITRDGPFAQQRPYVIGNTIHWPFDTIDTASLAHELTHVYQYQKRGWVYLREAAVLQAQYELWRRTGLGSNPYDYGGEDGLRNARQDGKTFGDFNVEQQGAIVEDYWRRRQNGEDTSVYDPYIQDLRDGKLKSERDPGRRWPLPIPWPPIISGPWPPHIPGPPLLPVPKLPLPPPPWEWFD